MDMVVQQTLRITSFDTLLGIAALDAGLVKNPSNHMFFVSICVGLSCFAKLLYA